MNINTLMILMIPAMAALPCIADVVVLIDGNRIECEVLSQTDDTIKVRTSSADGKIHRIEHIARNQIAQIIEADVAPASQPASLSPTRAVTTRAPSPPMTAAEKRELLDTAIHRYQHRLFTDASRRIARMLRSCDEQECRDYSKITEQTLQLSLAEFAADAHVQAAIVSTQRTNFTLRYVTMFELPAVRPCLTKLYEHWLTLPADAKPGSWSTPATSQPASQADKMAMTVPTEISEPVAPPGPTLAEWLDRPTEFEGTMKQRHELAQRALLLINLLDEWQRVDRDLRTDFDRYDSHVKNRVRLDTFVRQIAPQRYAPQQRKQLERLNRDYDRMLAEQRQQWLNNRQDVEAQNVIEAVQKQQEQEEDSTFLGLPKLRLFSDPKPDPQPQPKQE